MTPEEKAELTRRVTNELDRSVDWQLAPALSPPDALALISQLQCGARHPASGIYGKAAGRRIAHELTEQLAHLGLAALAEAARLGWEDGCLAEQAADEPDVAGATSAGSAGTDGPPPSCGAVSAQKEPECFRPYEVSPSRN